MRNERERRDAGGAEGSEPRPEAWGKNSTPTLISTASTLKRSSTGIGCSPATIARSRSPAIISPCRSETIRSSSCVGRRVDTRPPQFLPASRFAHMPDAQGLGEAPRMSLSSVDLRSGRRIDSHASHGRERSTRRNLGSSPSIAKAFLVISLCASRRLRRVSNPSERRRKAICRRTDRRRQSRLRKHDRRKRQLEARLGKQPRVLPLRGEPSGTVPDLP